MKKVLLILVIAALLISFVGCGGALQEQPQATTTTSSVTDTTTVESTDNTTQTTASTIGSASVSKQPTSSSSVRQSTTTTTKTKPSKFTMHHYYQHSNYIEVRGGLKNTGYKIAQDGALQVAFMGGSVTNGMGSTNQSMGYRGRLLTHLRSTYNAVFSEIDASMGGNGSTYGVYFTEQFVASKNPDLVFIEYAINNAHDGVKDAKTLWNHYETMIHTIREANPYADIVLLYVSNEANQSRDIVPILEEIADKYQLVSVHLYQAIIDVIETRPGVQWSALYTDGSHPNDAGYDIMAGILKGMMEYALSMSPFTYQKMATPSAQSAIQTEAKAVMTSSLSKIPAGWQKVSNFSYASAGKLYNGCIQTTQTDKAITVRFKGTDFGLLLEYAKDAGVLEYSVDGGAAQTLDCYLSYSNPKARLLLKDGADTEHTVTFQLKTGSRMAIAAFLLNGTILSVE